MLSDQDVGERGVPGVFVEFLGELASTPRGPAQLAMLAAAPIIPGFIVRMGGTKHRIVIDEPILPPEGHGEESVRQLTAAYTKILETYVRRYPGHWLWTHRRWKTRPT
jgi:KDO2-lipid IV(A) lauroyltransferase